MVPAQSQQCVNAPLAALSDCTCKSRDGDLIYETQQQGRPFKNGCWLCRCASWRGLAAQRVGLSLPASSVAGNASALSLGSILASTFSHSSNSSLERVSPRETPRVVPVPDTLASAACLAFCNAACNCSYSACVPTLYASAWRRRFMMRCRLWT